MTLFMFVCIYFGIWNRGISCIGTHDEGYTGKKNPLKLQHPLAHTHTPKNLLLLLSVRVEQKSISFHIPRGAKSFFPYSSCQPSTLEVFVRGWKRSIITGLSADWSATVARALTGKKEKVLLLPPFFCLTHKQKCVTPRVLSIQISGRLLECSRRIWKSELCSKCHPAQSSLFRWVDFQCRSR